MRLLTCSLLCNSFLTLYCNWHLAVIVVALEICTPVFNRFELVSFLCIGVLGIELWGLYSCLHIHVYIHGCNPVPQTFIVKLQYCIQFNSLIIFPVLCQFSPLQMFTNCTDDGEKKYLKNLIPLYVCFMICFLLRVGKLWFIL